MTNKPLIISIAPRFYPHDRLEEPKFNFDLYHLFFDKLTRKPNVHIILRILNRDTFSGSLASMRDYLINTIGYSSEEVVEQSGEILISRVSPISQNLPATIGLFGEGSATDRLCRQSNGLSTSSSYITV